MPCSGFKWVEVARGVLLLTGDRLGINQQMMSNCTVHHLGFILKNSISNYHDFKKLFQLFNCSYPNPEGFLWFSSPSHRGGDRGVSYCLEELCSSSAKLLQHKQNWRQKAACPMGWEGVSGDLKGFKIHRGMERSERRYNWGRVHEQVWKIQYQWVECSPWFRAERERHLNQSNSLYFLSLILL